MKNRAEHYRLGTTLKTLREQRGFKQEELAKMIGVDRTSLSSYENNKRVPDIYILWRMADIFQISLDELVGRS